MLSNGTSLMPIPPSCPKLFKFLCGPTQCERGTIATFTFSNYINFLAFLSDSDFGEGSDVIWLDDVRCNGSEKRLADCRHAGWAEHNCDPSDNVAVRCVGKAQHIILRIAVELHTSFASLVDLELCVCTPVLFPKMWSD